jgi:hypothetical protein
MYSTPRLVVTTVALRVMEALLVLLAVAALLLCLYNFKPVSQHPPSLIAIAAVLARSPQLAEILGRNAVPRLETLAADLSGCLLSSPPDLQTIRVHNDPEFNGRHVATGNTKAPLHINPTPPVKW